MTTLFAAYLVDQADNTIEIAALDLERVVLETSDSTKLTNVQRRIGRLIDRLHSVQMQAGEKADAVMQEQL